MIRLAVTTRTESIVAKAITLPLSDGVEEKGLSIRLEALTCRQGVRNGTMLIW